MEPISNPLEKYKQKMNMQTMENVEISLSDIVKKYPELKEVPENEILIREDIIRSLDSARERCAECTKEGNELENCYYPVFDNYFGVILRVLPSACDKQKYHYKIKKMKKLLSISRIGGRFMNRTFENFKINSNNEVAYQKCKHYVDNFPHKDGQGLILIGGYGAGKTHLAVAILHALLQKNVNGLFATVPELLEEIKKNFNKDKGNVESDLLDSIKKAEFLILDDLGAEKPSDWVREQLFIIINARYEEMLPTVITTNYRLFGESQLEERIGARTFSRIIEMCNGVLLNDEDHRKEKLK